MLPRDSAGSFELKEGTGPITAVCPCGDFLEIYKIDKTFRIVTPETIDPDRTNPNALWTNSPHSDIGSSNPIVARILLQSHEILKAASFTSEVDKVAVTVRLHSCKEALLASELAANRIVSQIDEITDKVKNNGVVKDDRGRGLNPFPQVQNLDTDCSTFLIQINRAIKIICELPQFFLSLNRQDSNFEHLAKRLEASIGNDSPLTQFVKGNTANISYLIDLRNFHEHPNKNRRTIVDNFRLMPDSTIRTPHWHLSDCEPRSIKSDMIAYVEFLTQIAESMLIHLVMHSITKIFPYIIVAIPEDKVDATKPIRYELSLDVSKMNFPDN